MQTKKQAFELISDIMTLNQKQWNNPRFSFDPNASAALRIEEALETIGVTDAKEAARGIVDEASKIFTPPAEVDQLDSILDDIYICVGEAHKLGLTPHQLVDALQAVHNANKLKAGDKDSEGKVTKPKDFVGPETKLQTILDQRSR